MKEVTLQIHYQVFEKPEELPEADLQLLEAARSVCGNAYAPYSGYHVGAAVRLANGRVITGANQENAAFPSGQCAERVALYYAASRFPDSAVSAIAVVAESSSVQNPEPVTPCGCCRQALAETERYRQTPIRILLGGGEDKVYVLEGINNLLPLTFSADKLKKPDHGADLNKNL